MHKYGADVGYWDEKTKSYTVDKTWLTALPASAQKYHKLFEDSVVTPEFGGALKQCKIGGFAVSDGFFFKHPGADPPRRNH